MRYYLFNLTNSEISKKSWKTFNGAFKNSKEYEIVLGGETLVAVINWIMKHPDWAEKRIEMMEQYKN